MVVSSIVVLVGAGLLLSGQSQNTGFISQIPSHQTTNTQNSPSGNTQPTQDTKPSFTLTSLDGKTVAAKDFEGKPTILKLGTTYCDVCQREIPEVKRAYKEMGDKVNIVFVLIGASKREAQAYIDRYNLPYPVYLDPNGSVGRTFSVLGTPTHAILDSSGALAERRVGFMSTPQIISSLTNLL